MDRFLMIAGTLVAATAAISIEAGHDHHDIPHYTFKYVVSDPLTGDHKAQWETRYGNVVKGAYSLVEPDGTIRVVDYAADDLNGFNADVKKFGFNVHPPTPVTKIVTPIETISSPHKHNYEGEPINVPELPSLKQVSLPWSTITHSYGGWVPRKGRPLTKKMYLTILTKQRDHNGKLHHWILAPMPLNNRKVIVRH